MPIKTGYLNMKSNPKIYYHRQIYLSNAKYYFVFNHFYELDLFTLDISGAHDMGCNHAIILGLCVRFALESKQC